MAKLLILLSCISFCVGNLNAIIYDCVSGLPVSRAQLDKYEARNNSEVCTIDVEPCDPNEWKRLDGSCNNLKYPSRGTHRTPTIRLLEPEFSPNYEPKKAKDGKELPLARRLRTEILKTGKASDLEVSQLASYYILVILSDVNSIHDIINYILNIKHCCTPEGQTDYMCTPIKVPIYDPVHRFSGINCMNLTRPESYQTYGCLDKGTKFTRIVFQTPVFDLSNSYNVRPGCINQIRTYKNGLLKVEEENGLYFPPSQPYPNECIFNQRPRETRCHLCQLNNSLGVNLMNILFYLYHNHIAKKLQKLNPCWDDDRIFFTARDINIAISSQIFFYELLPIFFGRHNLIRDGVISWHRGFRDLYDENVPPQMSDEYIYVHRWFHVIQETRLKFFDKDGCFLKTFPLVNTTLRTGFFGVDDNMLNAIQGSFRQAGSKSDFTMDTDLADIGHGNMQKALDTGAADLLKGRYYGMPPYIKYREYCTKRSYKTFADLEDGISKERIHRLKHVYKTPEDIDLMSGLWAENHVRGGRVPETAYCLLVEQWKRSVASDRHWYERRNRPHAFTRGQLEAVRRVTIAGLLCEFDEFVTEIQPNAFYTISRNNPLTSCSSSKIGKLDVTAWKDSSCKKENNKN